MIKTNKINGLFANITHSQILVFLMFLGIAVRVLGISVIPSGLNQDEASIGYEAFSLLTTGLDRNANAFPVHFVSWGNGQNALYAYLSMPFISVFGLNAFSVRIVNALFSCLSLVVFYLLFKLIFDKKKALTALSLLVICPWSIMSARWGLESNIFPTLFLFAVFFLLKGIHTSPKYFPLSFLLFAFSLYAYGTSYLILPLFFLLTVPYLIHKKHISIRYSILSLSLFLIIALPIILFVIINHLDLNQIQLFNFTIPKLGSNRTTVIFNLFTTDFISVFAKNVLRFLNILVLQSDGNDYNAIPSFGTIYIISFPFFIIGLLNIFRERKFVKETHHFIFFSWLLVSFILGITSHININRINILFYPMLYFVVLGLFDVYKMLKSEFTRHYQVFFICCYTTLFMLFAGYYIVIFREKIKEDFSYGLGDAIQYAEKINTSGTINITKNTINMPYIYVCFYNQIDPDIFRKTVIYKDINNGFREVQSFGRYTFGNNLSPSNTIQIRSKDEMNLNNFDVSKYKNFGNYYVSKKAY